MTKQMDLGGSFTLPGTSMTLNRMGYGAMQLAGPQVWGPPRDVDGAIAVVREAVAAGVNHIDTGEVAIEEPRSWSACGTPALWRISSRSTPS
jgi:pyridoxine 4-dehydrogenase